MTTATANETYSVPRINDTAPDFTAEVSSVETSPVDVRRTFRSPASRGVSTFP